MIRCDGVKIKEYTVYVCDFETTVYEGQEYTEVWAAGIVEMYTNEPIIFNSIDLFFEYVFNLPTNSMLYFHNLKFDGSFIIPYLLQTLEFKQAFDKIVNENNEITYIAQKEKDMKKNTFKYSISDRGQWYSIIIKVKNKYIEIRDSYKLLPFSVADISKCFETTHKKLDIEYEGFRYAGGKISKREQGYLKNDLLVVKEALEFMFNAGHDSITIGSCCLREFKKMFDKKEWDCLFPDLYKIPCEDNKFKSEAHFIRRSYKGGWCYLVEGKENKVYYNGITLDVYSLYPSVMHSSSGNCYPVGKGTYFKAVIPDICNSDNIYYFVRIKTRFKIKDGFLPFIQIKGSFLYQGNKSLTTSDFYNAKTNTYTRYLKRENGDILDSRVELTLTKTDYILFLEHYDVFDFEIIDGYYYRTAIGLFDEYLNKYNEIKKTSTGSMRTEAKLFMNNLYGKLSMNDDSSFKMCYIKDTGVLSFIPIEEHNKKGGYIPCGSAITSYARNFTIRAAQANYYGKDRPGFIYADTDSLHLDLPLHQIRGCEIGSKDFGFWEHESSWKCAIFARQKTYIEVIEDEEGKLFYDIKCAGMPRRSKEIFKISVTGEYNGEPKHLTELEKEFIKKRRTIKDFKIGLKVPGSLKPKRIKGGIVLINDYYEMR